MKFVITSDPAGCQRGCHEEGQKLGDGTLYEDFLDKEFAERRLHTFEIDFDRHSLADPPAEDRDERDNQLMWRGAKEARDAFFEGMELVMDRIEDLMELYAPTVEAGLNPALNTFFDELKKVVARYADGEEVAFDDIDPTKCLDCQTELVPCDCQPDCLGGMCANPDCDNSKKGVPK